MLHFHVLLTDFAKFVNNGAEKRQKQEILFIKIPIV